MLTIGIKKGEGGDANSAVEFGPVFKVPFCVDRKTYTQFRLDKANERHSSLCRQCPRRHAKRYGKEASLKKLW